MNSIFSLGYVENLKRLAASSKKNSLEQPAKDAPERHFDRVLSDVEKSAKIRNSRGQLSDEPTKQPTQSVALLSNLDPKETERLIKDLPSLVETSVGEAGRGVSMSGKVELSVNIAENRVNKLTSLPTATIPPPPALLSATRVPRTRNYAKLQADDTQLKQIISRAGGLHGVDPTLSIAVAAAESSLRPHAISRDGHATKGLFQLLDTTGKEMRKQLGLEAAYNPYDAHQNANLGVGYLRKLHDIFSKETVLNTRLRTYPASSAADLEKLAIAAFNAGEGNVATAQAKAAKLGHDPTKFESVEPHLPSSTRAYVTRVSNLRVAFAREDSLNKIV